MFWTCYAIRWIGKKNDAGIVLYCIYPFLQRFSQPEPFRSAPDHSNAKREGRGEGDQGEDGWMRYMK